MDLIDILLGAKFGGGGGSSTFVPSFGTVASVSLGTTWSGNDPYTSTVTVTGYTVTDKTMVSVLPSTAVLTQMLADGTTNIYITNNNGTLTATALGAAPTQAMTLTVLCSESDQAAVIGNLAGIVGDGVIETLQAADLTDAVNQLGTDVSDVKNAISQKAPVIVNAQSGNAVYFKDGSDLPLKKLILNILPLQTGSGDPSSENIRPLSGWSKANVYHTKRNILAPELAINRINRVRINDTTGVIGYNAYSDVVDFPMPSGIFYLQRPSGSDHINGLSNNPQLAGGDAVSVVLPYKYGSQQTVDNTAGYKYFYAQAGRDGGAVWSTITVDAVVPAPNNKIADGQGEKISIDWASIAGTVYAGTLNTITGEIKARPYYASYNGETLVGPWISDRDVYVEGTSPTIGAQVVDLGGTETTYQIDPTEVSTWLGENTIWADVGAVDLEYRADTKLYINGLTAPDEDMIADANIASGKYFVVNNQLYLSTAAIAAGASIIPGTNCTATNIAAALNAINT